MVFVALLVVVGYVPCVPVIGYSRRVRGVVAWPALLFAGDSGWSWNVWAIQIVHSALQTRSV